MKSFKTARKIAKARKKASRGPKKEYNFIVFEEKEGGMQEELLETSVRPDAEQAGEVARIMAEKGSDAVMDYFLGIVLKANPKLKGKQVRLVKTD